MNTSRAGKKKERIEQKRHDLKRRDGKSKLRCGGNGYQHLSSVGNHSLKHAREGIEQRSRLAPRNIVGSGHLRSDRIGHDNGNGVVRCGDIHGSNKQTHAEHAPFAGFKQTLDAVEQGDEAAMLWMRAQMALTNTATIVVSNIPAAPDPILARRSVAGVAPVAIMMIEPETMPRSKTTNTLMPTIPPTSTIT